MSSSKEPWAINADTAGVGTPKKTAGSLNAIVGQGCRIIGDLELEGDVRIDGAVEGEIKLTTGKLVIGETATINAKIFARIVNVFGRVDGDIVCSERLEIHSGACVTGTIASPRLIIEDGVVFEGSCQMSQAQAAHNDSGEKVIDIKVAVGESAEI